MFTYLPFIDPLKSQQTIKSNDLTRMASSKDFNTNIKNDALQKSPLSRKVYIQPVSAQDKSGSKWYAAQ